jgi:hypothetical protein
MVASNSAAVSPGKPTIKSDDKAISGRACLKRLILALYSNAV